MSCSTLTSRKKLLPKSKVLKFQIIIRKRSQAGLSKPNCFSKLLMNSGSRPCAPRYFELTSPPAVTCPCPRAPKSPPCEPEMREVAPVSEPEICAITRSTGPPGANCATMKDTSIDRKSTRLKLQSHSDLVCRLLLEKKKKDKTACSGLW